MASAPAPGNWVDMSETQGGVVHYRVVWTSGSSGAVPTFPLSCSEYITSVTHGSTGVYTIVLQNSFYQLVGFSGTVMQASYSASAAGDVHITTAVPATGTITILVTKPADGTAGDPTTSDVVILDIIVQNYKSQMG